MVKRIEQMLLRYLVKTNIPDEVEKKVSMTRMEMAVWAKQLLSNPLWEMVLDEIKQDALHQCEISPARDVEGREYFWKYIKVIEQFKARLRGCLSEMKLREKIEPTL